MILELKDQFTWRQHFSYVGELFFSAPCTVTKISAGLTKISESQNCNRLTEALPRMRGRNYVSYIAAILAITFYAGEATAGCLEPTKEIGAGIFIIEKCSFHNTTNSQYEDSRIVDPTDKSALHDNKVGLIGSATKKKGIPRIFELNANDVGVLLTGKFDSSVTTHVAYLQTRDANFCKQFVKNERVDLALVEECCDCQRCTQPPCALGTKTRVTNFKGREVK